MQYVAATLCRPESEIIPLAAVIQSKTGKLPSLPHAVHLDGPESLATHQL